MYFVAGGVAVEFLQPEGTILRRRRAILAATMAMPEAAVHEDDSSVLRQHDVGLTRQSFPVKAESKAQPVKERANSLFGRCVFAANPAHVPGTALFAQWIAHVNSNYPTAGILEMIASPTSVSQIISATTEAGLIKPDEKMGASREFACFLPFWA